MPALACPAPGRTLRSAAGAFLLFAACTAAEGAEASLPAELSVPATNVLAAVSARYSAVTNVSCTVRRETASGGSSVGAAVSRVVWARGGRLNVQALAPAEKRTVIDGVSVWTAAKGGSPSSRAVAEQNLVQAANLYSVPASPEERLAPLDPATATEIVPAAEPFARQIAFRPRSASAATAASTVVSFDAEGRVVRLEAFADESRTAMLGSLSFESAVEAAPGAWLFGREVFETAVDGRPVRTVSRFDRLRVNEALPPSIFVPKAFF